MLYRYSIVRYSCHGTVLNVEDPGSGVQWFFLPLDPDPGFGLEKISVSGMEKNPDPGSEIRDFG